MSDVVSKWLTKTLGIIVEVYSDTFIRLIQNGYLVGAILRHYKIINSDHLTALTSSGDSTNQIDRIAVWLKEVNIHLDDETKRQLEKGKISTALDLLYKLYLVFQGKDPLHYTTKQIQVEKLRDVTTDKFQVTPVVPQKPDPSEIPPHPLSSILTDYKHVVQWHTDRYNQLLHRCHHLKEHYAHIMSKRLKGEVSINFRPVVEKQEPVEDLVRIEDLQSLEESYDELVKQENKALGQSPFMPDVKVTKRIVKNIKNKFDKERVDIAFQSKMETMVLAHFWDDILESQSKKIDAHISEKILKQSYYEKQMTNKMFEIREQKETITENRLTVLQEIQKKKDNELLERIFAKEKISSDERYRYYFERDRALELHRRIYAEKERLKLQRKVDMCKSVSAALIDISLRRVEYKEEFEEELPKSMLADLASLFVSDQPIFDLVPNDEVIIEYEPINDAEEEIYLEEIDRQNAMDIRSFENYCNFEWPWEIEQHVPDYAEKNILSDIEMAMNILGHIVFRLLLAKYPKPPLKPPPNIPKVHVAVCINNISDLTILPILDKLLSERQVKIIQMEDAINYCLAAYKDETTVEYPESQFVDETQDALHKSAAKRSGKKSKENITVKRKGEKKGKKKPANVDHIDSFVGLPFQEKQIQTPRIFPCEEPILTSAAGLGRQAYEVLELGEGINDKLLVQLFVEYLKTLKDIDGWCLINYPTNIAQTILLEEALTSRAVPLNIDNFENTKKTIEQLGDEIIKSNPSLNIFGSNESFGIKALYDSKQMQPEGVTQKCNSQSKSNQPIDETNNEGDNVEDIADLDYRTVQQNTVMDDPNAEFRISRILKNPDVLETIEDYNCYLTAFVKVIQDVSSKTQIDVIDDELDEIHRFYQRQGCLYNLYYKSFDLATVKHIGKLIIGDYTIPPKTSVQIFGDTVLYLENDPNLNRSILGNISKSKFGGPKKEKPPKSKGRVQQEEPEKTDEKHKKGKKEKKEKGAKSSKGGKKTKGEEEEAEPDVIILKMDKETQFPELPAELEIIQMPEPDPKPGQRNWKYVDLPIPQFFQVALATLWENIEEIYVCDFRELFFRRRVLWKTVMPYLNFVKRYMRDFINRPDDKQIHLYNFQKLYNEIDADMRDDDELKAELHCRIQEFREKLWQICDSRMQESEKEREIVIMRDWTAKQACELTNVYITAMQLEIDRTVDTLQLLNDYYVAMITKMPCSDDVFGKIFLNYITFKDDFEFENYQSYSSYVRNCLLSGNKNISSSPYHTLIEQNHKESMKTAQNYQQKSSNILAGMESYFQPKGKKNKPAKDSKGKPKNKGKLPKFTTPDPEVKEVAEKLIAEWRCAIEGEFARVCLRLDLLKTVAGVDLTDMLTASMKTFSGLYDEIKERYDKEMDSIKQCCEVLSRAVEEEIPIQPELVLSGDTFYVNPDVLLFDNPLPEPDPIIRESEASATFTIPQLSHLMDILFDLAPSGIMPERAFTFLLQDMIVNNAEDGRSPLVPELWQQLQTKNMNGLSFEFFGHVELVDWKDFIIYNLCVEFPTEIQLIQTRRQFREFDVDSNEYVYDYQFNTIRFWFESEFDLEDPQQVLRLRGLKNLLIKLYGIGEDRINYTAMLLAFCKDTEACLGLAKALALSLGKLVCWEPETGNAFVTILRQRQLEKLQDEMRLKMEETEKLETVEEVVDDLIDVTIHQCDSCYLESYCSLNHSNENNDGDTIKESITNPELEYLENLMKEYETRYNSQQYEENATQFLLLEQFSNVEIGFEPEYYPTKVYYLIFDVLLTVAMAAMPWQAISKNDGEPSFRQTLETLYNACKNPEFDNLVLMHEFLNNERVKELFGRNFKFVVKKPSDIIDNLVEER